MTKRMMKRASEKRTAGEGGRKTLGILITILGILFMISSAAPAAAKHGETRTPKKGILLVAFGSSEASAQVSFENIDRKIKSTFQDIPVYWAYTSHIIRNKLAAQGRMIDAPEVALAKMRAEGFTHVAVQSLHTIMGEEYEDLQTIVNSFRQMGGFDRIILSRPLMATQEDMKNVVDAIIRNIPKERKPGEAVILMGHGTPHPSNAFYAALMFQLQLKDPNIFVGTVEGYPELDDIRALISKKKIKKAYLSPFMSVAGDHAKNDMAGDEDDSWKSILTKDGIECRAILKGTAEFDDFLNIWVSHLKEVVQHF